VNSSALSYSLTPTTTKDIICSAVPFFFFQ